MPKRPAAEHDRLEGDHCITIQIPLSSAFGTKAEHAWCSRLEDLVEDALRQSASGHVDGTETGMGTWTLYLYGRRASTMWKFIETPLVAAKCPDGSFATIRSGDSIFTKEVVVPLFGPHAGKKPQAVKLLPAERLKNEDNEPKPGDVYAFNFSEGGVGAIVVARTDRAKHKNAYALVYAMGQRFSQQPTPRQVQQFNATQAILLFLVPKVLLKSKRVCFLGRLRGFSTDAWPQPPNLLCDRSSHTTEPDKAPMLSVQWASRENLVQIVRCDAPTEASRIYPEIRTADAVSMFASWTHLAMRGTVARFRAGNVQPETIDETRLARWRAAEATRLPQHDDAIWRTAKPHEGLVLTFPFETGGFGVALIARYDGRIAEYHVFNLHGAAPFDSTIVSQLKPRSIAASMRCTIKKAISGEYIILGNLPDFSRASWAAAPALRTKRRDWRGWQCDPSDEGRLEPSFDVESSIDDGSVIRASARISARFRECTNDSSSHFWGDALPLASQAVKENLPHITLECTDTTFDLWREIDQLFIDRMKTAKPRSRR
jgi:hypothetical protein